MRTILSVFVFSAISLGSQLAPAAKDLTTPLPNVQKVPAVVRCVRYFTSGARRKIHKIKYGELHYRSRHNERALKEMIDLRATGRGIKDVHQRDFFLFKHVLEDFYEKLMAHDPVNARNVQFIFNSRPTRLYPKDSDDPSVYEAGIILIVERDTHLVVKAFQTELLRQMYNIKDTDTGMSLLLGNVSTPEL